LSAVLTQRHQKTEHQSFQLVVAMAVLERAAVEVAEVWSAPLFLMP